MTGCDTTSAFKIIGKKKAYEALKAYPDIETVFANSYRDPFPVFDEEDERFKKIERFVILIYSQTSNIHDVNEARMDFYFSKKQNIETIPPQEILCFYMLNGVCISLRYGVNA